MPITLSEDISKQLSATIQIVPNGGHLNASAGITEFAELKEAIESNG